MNKITLLGNLGAKPELKEVGGTKICTFSLATKESYKDKQGNKVDETQWHRCIAFGKMAENLSKYFDKGNQILIEGKVKYGEYEKDGVKHKTTDIVINAFHFLNTGNKPAMSNVNTEDITDDLPF